MHPPLAHAPLIPGHSFFRLSALHCSLLVPKAKGDLSCPRLLPVITRPQLRRALVVNNPNYVGASSAAEGRVTATASNGAWGPIYVSGPSNNNTGAIGTGYNILLAGAAVLAMLCCSRLRGCYWVSIQAINFTSRRLAVPCTSAFRCCRAQRLLCVAVGPGSRPALHPHILQQPGLQPGHRQRLPVLQCRLGDLQVCRRTTWGAR